MEDIYPVEVKLIAAERRLHITWSNDHVSPFSLSYLRGWCPCAVCQGHFQEEWKYQDVPEVALTDVKPVGNYGMKLFWSDGHDTGIYQFDVLYAMCTCTTCDPEQVRVNERTRPRLMMSPT